MLRLARTKLSDQSGIDYELQQGDITRLSLASASADTVVMHQVLHFLPAPELAISEAARIVAPGGRLLIVDFAPHDEEELRVRDAHSRLGFSDEQIAAGFATAGLSMVEIQTLAGGTLTVKLWLGVKSAAAKLKVVGS
jgi:ubiquinone/menaquinone biosynthesis C-methylase UbiE